MMLLYTRPSDIAAYRWICGLSLFSKGQWLPGAVLHPANEQDELLQ